MTPEDVKTFVDEALKNKAAEAILNGDDFGRDRAATIRAIIHRIPDEVLEEIMIEMFKELTA